MAVCRPLLKIILFPVSLILLLIKGLINLVINLTSAVVGLFVLYIGTAVVYCLVSQSWRDLMIFLVIGIMILGILFVVVMLEEIIDVLRNRLKDI